MFTIKWFSHGTNYRCLAVREFEVSHRDGKTFVLMHVAGEDGHWEWQVKAGQKVYVENAMGKTIDLIRSTELTPVPA